MTLFKVENNELEPSGEPQASTLYIYISIWIVQSKLNQYIGIIHVICIGCRLSTTDFDPAMIVILPYVSVKNNYQP